MPPTPVYLVKFDGIKEERIRAANLEDFMRELQYRIGHLGKPFEWIIRVYD